MGLDPPDSCGKSRIVQHRSSSSPSPSIDSPTDHSPLCLSTSSSSSRQPFMSCLAPSLASVSSSSSLALEIVDLPENNLGPQQRSKKSHQYGAHKNCKDYERPEQSVREKRKQVTSHTSGRASADIRRKRKGCQENVCGECAAGLMADCAAICCCPLALLHLAALTFIRLPAAVSWKILMRVKNKMYTKRRRPSSDRGQDSSPMPKYANPWLYGGSREGMIEPSFTSDSQDLWQLFEGSNLDFGNLSMRRGDPMLLGD